MLCLLQGVSSLMLANGFRVTLFADRSCNVQLQLILVLLMRVVCAGPRIGAGDELSQPRRAPVERHRSSELVLLCTSSNITLSAAVVHSIVALGVVASQSHDLLGVKLRGNNCFARDCPANCIVCSLQGEGRELELDSPNYSNLELEVPLLCTCS